MSYNTSMMNRYGPHKTFTSSYLSKKKKTFTSSQLKPIQSNNKRPLHVADLIHKTIYT